MLQHQYIERDSGRVTTEVLLGDAMVRLLYHQVRENSTRMFNLLTSNWSSQLLASVNFDRPLVHKSSFSRHCGINLSECLDPPEQLEIGRAHV